MKNLLKRRNFSLIQRVRYSILTVFTIRKTVFQKEWAVTEQLATVCAIETLGMELFADGIQAILW